MFKRLKRNRQARADRARLIEKLESLRQLCLLSIGELQLASAVVANIDAKIGLAIAEDDKRGAERLLVDLQNAAAWQRSLMCRESELNRDLTLLVKEIQGLKYV